MQVQSEEGNHQKTKEGFVDASPDSPPSVSQHNFETVGVEGDPLGADAVA